MDFTVSETQQEIAGLAARVLRGARPVPVAVPPGVATGRDGGYDATAWKELAQTGLLSLALPEELGGDGLGAAEAGALLAEAGRAGAAVPVLATVMTGVLPVTRWAGRDLAGRLLAGVGTGGTVLTAALREPSQPRPALPETTATLEGGGTVTGVKIGVPYAAEADWVLVPARLAGGGTAVVVISPAADGVTTVRTPSSAGDPEYTLRLAATPVTGVLGDEASAGDPVTGLYELAVAGACCVADGALAAALALTTEHLRTRQQFGRPLATFQAAAQHIADVYIAARTLHLATLSACWRLSAGLDAGPDLDVAAFWLASRGPAAMRTCHHLHGGTGMDVSYPLARLSALVKDLARYVGGASYTLDRLGDRV